MTRPWREQQAWDEVGRTEISRARAAVLIAIGLAMLVSVALRHESWSGPLHGQTPLERLSWAFLEVILEPHQALTHNEQTLAEIGAFEEMLESSSWLRELALPVIQEVLTRWGRVAHAQVYLARDRWLYYDEDVEYAAGKGFLEPAVLERRRAEGKEPDPIPALVDLHRQLERRGIRLIVLPIPPKGSLAAQPLAAQAPLRPAPAADVFVAHNASWGELLRRLDAAGVEVFDPTPMLAPMGQQAFLRTDLHWSPAAMDAVAVALARRLEELGLGVAEPPYELYRRREQRAAMGDLALRLGLRSPERLLGLEQIEVEVVHDQDGQPWQPEHRAEVLLLGDSFASVFSWSGLHWGSSAGLGEQLSFHLRQPVDRLAMIDQGDQGIRQRLALESRDADGRLAGKRVVVYEFLARKLTLGNWPVIDLPPSAEELKKR